MMQPNDESNAVTPEQWKRVDEILQRALDCDPSRRAAFVEVACADDEEVRREVLSLLGAHDRTSASFLEVPAAVSLALGNGTSATAVDLRLTQAFQGRYHIERELAHGGMATVYLARDVRHDRLVAIKVLREQVAAAVGADRFLGEIKITATLQHPNILPLFDSGTADGLLWYAMPFVEGETLRARLTREGRLPADSAVQIARDVAGALEYAHGRGVIHRDVKPENVLLQGERALLADFGISLALERLGGERLTNTGITIGTPQYMAPEQAAGARELDARTDIYALGVVLHEMLEGEPPFRRVAPHAGVPRVTLDAPRELGAQRRGISELLESTIQRALASRPSDRFPSAAAFAAALTAPPTLHEDEEKGRSRGRVVSARRALYAAAAMLAVGLVGGWLVARAPMGAGDALPNVTELPLIADITRAATGSSDGVLTVVDREGRPMRAIAASRPWTPRISPDGRRLVYGAFGPQKSSSDLWVVPLEGGAPTRLTNDEKDSNDPQWSADGSRIAYSVSASGGKDVVVRNIDGGQPRLVTTRAGNQFSSDWSPDGEVVAMTDDGGENGRNIVMQPVDGSTAWSYVATSADEQAARIAPNGRWVAYTSNASGRPEVYLDTYPRATQRISVSRHGGFHPVWRADGREVYYWRGDALLAVSIDVADGVPALGAEKELFRASYVGGLNLNYDVSPDGNRFVIVTHRRVTGSGRP